MLATALVLVMVPRSYAQGMFLFSNISAPTRLWTIDGPLAGPGIWAQMLAGPGADSLAAIGIPQEHYTNGRVSGDVVAVPDIPAMNSAYVQMVAWDGTLWGTNLTGVPADQLGRTDTVTVFLTYPFDPHIAPRFTQPAIVPIPEPSVLALTVLAGAALFVWRRRRGRVPARDFPSGNYSGSTGCGGNPRALESGASPGREAMCMP